MIVGSVDDELSDLENHHHHRAVPPLLMEDLRELAYGIEDCMDRVLYQAIRKQHSSLLGRGTRFPKTLLTDRWLATEIQRLKKLTKEVHKRKQRFTSSASGQLASSVLAEESSSGPVFDPSTVDPDLVGVNGPMADLLEQLAEEAEGGAKKHKVVAIVGFSGMGKTALAAKVYNSEIGRGSFVEHAWVSAADRRPAEVLTQLLRKITASSSQDLPDLHQITTGAGSSQGTSESEVLPALQKLCAQHLMNKRYLIVIDDIRTEDLWTKIKSAFPVDDGISSRIVITTTLQRVANDCTSIKGCVLRMSRLDEECSKKLFCMKASPTKEFLSYNHPDSETILKKCRGQPLALVTVAKFLRTNGWPTQSECKNLCRQLNYHLENDSAFESMRRVLIRNYTSLRGHVLKSCLLYFAMFPSDYQIRRESLLRRWLAEGFVELHSDSNHSTPDPATAFHVLMDRNIIEPTYVSNNERVKTCRTYGLMHEFILHMSINQNFSTLLCGEVTEQKYVRRISLHKNTAKDGHNLETEVLSLVRSLSIFGEASDTILDFSKYHLLRVLDLEKCDNLENDHLNNICSLLLLKYLSLGKNISILPKDITKLRVLETLDLRGSAINILPENVLRMPCLIHLFGRFKLPDELKPKSQDFLQQKKSKLQTLAGFIADGKQDYLNLMGCMEKLKKVKVHCKPLEGAATTNWTSLRKAINQFIQDKKQVKTGVRSLSLHFSECFGDSINSLEGPCYLSSLKLHGKLHALPQFVTSLRGLEELCLQSDKLERGLLEALTELGSLKYLKLVAKDLDNFVIKDGAFPLLLRLCFVLERPTFPRIQNGSMPLLVTLQLLCKDMDGLCGIEMEYLTTELKEIILDHGVNRQIRGKWEEAAKKHPNKPKVFSRITSLSGATGNEESGTIDHGVNLELSRTESLENYLDVVPEQSINGTIDHGVAPEESTSRTSVQQSTSYSDDSSKIWCCHGLFAVPLPHIRRLYFMGLILCVLVFLLLVGCSIPSSNKFC